MAVFLQAIRLKILCLVTYVISFEQLSPIFLRLMGTLSGEVTQPFSFLASLLNVGKLLKEQILSFKSRPYFSRVSLSMAKHKSLLCFAILAHIWVTTWQNQQSGIYAKGRLRSAWASTTLASLGSMQAPCRQWRLIRLGFAGCTYKSCQKTTKRALWVPDSHSHKDLQIYQVICSVRLSHYPRYMMNTY